MDRAAYIARVAVNNARYRTRNREKVREFLAASQCADCLTSEFAILEFDHREPEHKAYEIGRLVTNAVSWESVATEMAKCDVVCANCHRRRTAQRANWNKRLGSFETRLPTLPKRGTSDYERIKSVRSCIARRLRNRALLFSYLTAHPCTLCGEADPVVLDFDHLRDKISEVTLIANASGMVNLLAEISKCRVLCANCHRRHTAQTAGRSR